MDIDLLEYEKGRRHWLHPLEKYKNIIEEEREKFLREHTGDAWEESKHPRGQPGNAGQFSSQGGGGKSSETETKQTTSFVSPNEDPNNLSFEQAQEGLKSPRQKLLAGISHTIDSDLGISDIRVNHVLGAWADGAENSVMTNSAATDPDIEEAAAAMKAYLANQKAVLLFHPDEDGHQFLAQFRTKGTLGEIHEKLLKNGVAFHTLEPRGVNDIIVHFYGESPEDVSLFDKAAKQFDNATVHVEAGHGKFIPPEQKQDGTDAEQREFSRKAYLETIQRVGSAGKLGENYQSRWQNHIDNWQRETGERIGEGKYKSPGSAGSADRITTDAYDPSEKRDPSGKWTKGGGGTVITRTSPSPPPAEKLPPWIQELAEREKNRPGVVSKASMAAVHGARYFLGEVSKEDYETIKDHLEPHSKARESHARRILRIAGVLPALLKGHFKEEYHKFKNAAGALKALATGHRPTPQQWKGLRQTAVTIALTAAVFMLTGEPSGAAAHGVEQAIEHTTEHVAEQVAGHAVEHGAEQVAEQVAGHIVEHGAEHSMAVAAGHLATEFGHELATHTILEHSAKFGLGAARFAASAMLGIAGEHASESETKDAETDEPQQFSADEIKLLQDYLQTLSKVVASYPISDAQLRASLPDNKEDTKEEPQPNKTKDRRWRNLIIHTRDGIFKFPIARIRDAWNEEDHPRGQPGNAGQFASQSGGKSTTTPRYPAQHEAKHETQHPQYHEPKADTYKPLKGSKGHPGLISPALPKGKSGEYVQLGLDLIKRNPKQFADHIQVYKENPAAYPIPEDQLQGDNDTVARNIINHIKSNLKFIYDNTPKETRDKTKQWYDGARKLVDEHVANYKGYGLKDTTVAGVYACLSPNNLWDQNVRQGDQMIDIYLKHRHEPWDKKMDDAVTKTKNPTVQDAMRFIQGKKYDELDTPEEKGLWIRVYDEGHAVDNPEYKQFGFQPFHKVTPEGKREGWYTNPVNVNKNRAFAWQSGTCMGKAIKILESGGDPRVIDDALKMDDKTPPQHKVRSFYNNILDPNSENEDVTMDTHAIDAAWLMDDPIAVAHNFGDTPQLKSRPSRWVSAAPATVTTGTSGNYAFNAEAYRELASDLHLKARELQSIIWETKRKWMTDTMSDANHKRMQNTWEDYRLGLLTQEEAQKKCKQIIDDDLSISDEQKRANKKARAARLRQLAKIKKPDTDEEDG